MVKSDRLKNVPTKQMEEAISRAKKLVLAGDSKACAARTIFPSLRRLSRQQILFVFREGCGLTPSGAATYYENIRKDDG